MDFRSRLARRLAYPPLVGMTVIFTTVSLRFLFATASNGAYLGMVPSPSNPLLGLMSIRIGYGIYTLPFIFVGLYALTTSKLRTGAAFVAVMMAAMLAVRLLNGFYGGAMAENPVILVGETVMLTLASVSLLLGVRDGKPDAAR